MIDDRIKLLSERIEREHSTPARVQREIAALIDQLVEERARVVLHPFDAGLPVDEAARKLIAYHEETLAIIRRLAEACECETCQQIVTIIDGPAIA